MTWVSSRMRILLRRWTTQFFDLEGVLEEDEPEPEVLEEVEDLQGEREEKKKGELEVNLRIWMRRIPAAAVLFMFKKRQPVGSVL